MKNRSTQFYTILLLAIAIVAYVIYRSYTEQERFVPIIEHSEIKKEDLK